LPSSKQWRKSRQRLPNNSEEWQRSRVIFRDSADDNLMQSKAKLLLLINSVALVSFFLDIENRKRSYLASFEGTGWMLDLFPPSPLSIWCFALGVAGICALFWALCKDLRARRRKSDETQLTAKCHRIRSLHISTTGLIQWLYLIGSLSLICLFVQVEADKLLAQGVLEVMKSLFTYAFLNPVALISLVLGFVGIGFSIRTAWMKWVRK
jgi:hypothetical protein